LASFGKRRHWFGKRKRRKYGSGGNLFWYEGGDATIMKRKKGVDPLSFLAAKLQEKEGTISYFGRREEEKKIPSRKSFPRRKSFLQCGKKGRREWSPEDEMRSSFVS